MNKSSEKVLKVFEEISKIPRCSKNEKKISDWLVNWAKEHNFDVKRDAAMNVLISVPATKGYENKPIIVLQGHMDMVCEKTPDSKHDFSKDPIEFIFDGDWLKANKTTLGADNGIALAIALAMVEDETVAHPPLELLFTVDEETGLTGANALESDFLKGKILINIDSEDEGVFTVGCAGGRDTKINLPLEFESPKESNAFEIKVSGLQGGHSGVDIKEVRANANILLARVLDALNKEIGIKIVNIKGGSAHNAIPRDALAGFTTNDKENAIAIAKKFETIFQDEYGKFEPTLAVTITDIDMPEKVTNAKTTDKIIALMLSMPHGIAFFSKDIEGLVETSNNFATIDMEDNKLKILSSQRSSIASRLDYLTRKIEEVAFLSGADYESGNGYPAWQPDMESSLLKKCVEVYETLYSKKPVVEVIHAGLECGIIGAKYDGMEMISIGPTIKNPHSPDEKLYLPSVEKIWDFLVAYFKSL